MGSKSPLRGRRSPPFAEHKLVILINSFRSNTLFDRPFTRHCSDSAAASRSVLGCSSHCSVVCPRSRQEGSFLPWQKVAFPHYLPFLLSSIQNSRKQTLQPVNQVVREEAASGSSVISLLLRSLLKR